MLPQLLEVVKFDIHFYGNFYVTTLEGMQYRYQVIAEVGFEIDATNCKQGGLYSTMGFIAMLTDKSGT